MKNYNIKRYEAKDCSNWNAFVSKSKNSTFLFQRDFMEYHNDRFQDYSLIVMEDQKWISVLPANCVESKIFSHQGLTYGGLVYNEKIKLSTVLAIFRSVLLFLDKNKIELLQIKTMPSIYHNQPAEELNYALFLAEAKLVRRDSLSVLDLSKSYTIGNGRKEGIKKGKNGDLKVKEVFDFDEFWNAILIPNLINKYQVKPIHNLKEITKLKLLFPKNIRQFNCYENGIIVAGTTIFESHNVAHSQYISANENKNENGSLDFLYHHLLTEVFKEKRFFDFGASTENKGQNLNEGLSFWKESFGAGTIVHDFYEVKTAHYSKFDTVIV